MRAKKFENMDAAIRRVMKIYDRADVEIAVYMDHGTVKVSKKDIVGHQTRIEHFQKNLIGVYDLSSDSRHIADDIGAYYKEMNGQHPVNVYKVATKSIEAPVFRSSGRRDQ